MRESVPPKRYADKIFTLKLSSHRKTKAKNDRKLIPVVVREVDKIGKRFKIHFVRFSEQFDEWRPFGSTDNFFFQGMEPLSIPSSTSLEDRMELVHGELYREIKRKFYSGQKDDQSTRVQVRIDQDVLI